MHWIGWWFMGWMPFLWIVFLILVVFLFFRVLGSPNERGGRGSGAETAEEILRRRYARGEIEREEYDRKLDDLRR